MDIPACSHPACPEPVELESFLPEGWVPECRTHGKQTYDRNCRADCYQQRKFGESW